MSDVTAAATALVFMLWGIGMVLGVIGIELTKIRKVMERKDQ